MAVESDLRARVGKLLRENGFMVQAIETGSIVEGVPDLWYSKHAVMAELIAGGKVAACKRGTVSGWIELKKIRDMPKKSTTSVFKSLNHPLSVEQQNWIIMAGEHGTSCWILVGYEREYFMVPGRCAHVFNDYTEEQLRKFQVQKADIPRMLLVPTL